MTTNYTPGPWRYEAGRDGRPPYVIRGTEGGFVVVGMTADRQEADARLIAAAPDYHDAAGWILAAVATNAAPVNVLAALEEMALDGKHVTLDAGLVLDLLKAHAKAKGEQQ